MRIPAGLAIVAICGGLALGGNPAAAQAPVRYGDWRADAPGVAHQITPADLPAPYSTTSDSNGPDVVSRPAGAAPKVPDGFSATLYVSGLRMPRSLRRAPDGDMFLAESGADRIRVIHPAPGGGAPTLFTFASGLSLPFGIAFWPPADPRYVYVANTDSVVRFPYRAGDTAARGPSEIVVPHLPEGGHWTRDLAAAPDGSRIFLSVGSASNVAGLSGEPPGGLAAWETAHGPGAAWGAETGRAAVVSLDPNNFSLRPYANGLRNCVGLAIQPGSGLPWCATNERDGLGDNLPPDYATSVAPGGFYGWPWFYIGAHADPRLHGARADLASRVSVPDVLIQPHSAPLGITFYDGKTFPAAYAGDAFVTLHGSWNRATRTGYKVVRLRFKDGKPTGAYEDFLTGFVASDSAVWGRPVGVAVTADGALLVSEDGNGTIWRIAYQH